MSGWPWPHPKPPTPPPSPAPATRTVAVIVRDTADENVNQARVELDDSPRSHTAFTVDGMVTFPGISTALSASHLWVSAEDYEPSSEHLDLPATDVQIWLGGEPDQASAIRLPALQPEAVALPRLRVNGDVFEREHGVRWTARQCSDFNLLNRWQHGEDIRPVLEQRQAAGFNLLRVWTLYDLASANIGTFLDIDYSRVSDFIRVCAGYGLYVEFTAYTSLERPDHWDRLVSACRSHNGRVLLELVNEGEIPVNQIDMTRYSRPSDVLCSHGSAGSETEPTWPAWDYCGWHTNGASEEQRKVGKQPFDYYRDVVGVPVLCGETSRYPDVGMWVGASLSRCEQLAEDSAAGAALLCAGSCFHSRQGKNSTLWDEPTFAVAVAWARGAMSVPLTAQHGAYVHRTDLESADVLRAYQRGEPVVRIRA